MNVLKFIIFSFLLIISLFITSCDAFLFLALDDHLPRQYYYLSTVDIDGDNYQKLISYFNGPPKFSYDDEKIIALDHDGFWKINSDGSSVENMILEFNQVHSRYFSISPIDESFVFSDSYDIYMFNINGYELINLTENLNDGIFRYPSFSPDGSKIILSAITYTDSLSVRSISEITLNDLNINQVFIVESPIEYPIYSQDMTKIFFKKTNTAICMCNYDGSDFQVITGGVIEDQISTGGDFLVFGKSPNIYTYNFINDQLVNLVEGEFPLVSNDGSKLLYNAYDSNHVRHLYATNIDGSSTVEHKRIDDNNYYSFSMSTEKIVYIRFKVTSD